MPDRVEPLTPSTDVLRSLEFDNIGAWCSNPFDNEDGDAVIRICQEQILASDLIHLKICATTSNEQLEKIFVAIAHAKRHLHVDVSLDLAAPFDTAWSVIVCACGAFVLCCRHDSV